MNNGRPIDARGWIFEVEDADAPSTWLPVGGITTFTHNPGENEETADVTVFDSEGFYEQDVMQRGATLSISGLYHVNKGTTTQDAGQAYIDHEWAQRLGIESRNNVRWRHKTQNTWVLWEATVTPGEQGGGNNEKTTWSATFTRCGAPTTAPVTAGTEGDA